MSDILPSTLGEPLGIVSERRRAAKDMIRHCRRYGMSATQLERYARLWGLQRPAEQLPTHDNPCGSASSPTPVRRGLPETARRDATPDDMRVIAVVLDVVASHYGVTAAQILSRLKGKHAVDAARSPAFAIIYERLRRKPPPLSFRSVGYLLNGRTETPVYKATRRHAEMLADDGAYRSRVREMEREITHRLAKA